MNSTFLRLFCAAQLVFLLSCSDAKNSGAFDLNAANQEMAQSGWNYFETHGEIGKPAGEVRSQSETGSIAANWMIHGKRYKKFYAQTNSLFLIVSCVKADGDSFAVVYTKPR